MLGRCVGNVKVTGRNDEPRARGKSKARARTLLAAAVVPRYSTCEDAILDLSRLDLSENAIWRYLDT